MDIGPTGPYTSTVDPLKHYPTWTEIDLAAIEANARALSNLTEAALMAVVKANAYGHGAVESSHAAIRGGARWLGVARPSEAFQLREAGIEAPILLLSPAPEARLAELVGQRVSLTVADSRQVDQAAAAADAKRYAAKLHLKLDTGMSRIGTSVEDALELATRISATENLELEGIFTHLARADEEDPTTTIVQLQRFEEALAALSDAGLRPPLIHAANSAATIAHPVAHFDMVRCGIALYGLHPSETCQLPSDFTPALQWKTQLMRVRSFPPETGISYGHDYVTQKTELIGTMPVGYADGLRRLDGNRALVEGEPVSIVGRVCMDLTMLQLDSVPEARTGDEVVLIGRQGRNEISAEAVAKRWGTINYEVTCAIGPRVPRLFL